MRIIAVDFDGTVCRNAWPDVGEAREDVLAALREAQNDGAKIILWTCREGALLRRAVNWLIGKGVIPDAVNSNLPELIGQYGGDCRKISATEYWDDRAITIQEERP